MLKTSAHTNNIFENLSNFGEMKVDQENVR